MDTNAFEHDRLELFRAAGFAGRSRWIDDPTLGCRTYAIQRGDGPCPTVLVHGGMADASVWYRLAGRLDGPVIILDRPGHGLTSDVDYTGLDYRQHAVDWLAGVVRALGVDHINLVGNSMGGYFATVFSLAHPTRVRRLVLAGAPAGTDRELPLFIRLWGMPLLGAVVGATLTRMRDPEQLRDRVMRSMCAHPELVSDQALRVQLAAGSRPGWNATIRSMIRAVSDLGGWRPELSIRDAMTALTVPTLFAWGDRDSFALPASGHGMAARMPRAFVEVLEDAGHLPQLDQPDALARSIARFVGDIDVASGRANVQLALDDGYRSS